MAEAKENLSEMSKEELQRRLNVLREEIRMLKFQNEGARSKNVKEVGGLRKQVARVLTQINQS
jgi:ribosomal protein L29